MNIIIPMAGDGTRFANAGFTLPKPLINVAGKAMYRHAIDNLPFDLATKLVFVIKKTNYSEILKDDIKKHYSAYPYSIIVLDNDTRGQAETVLKSAEVLDLAAPTLVHNCDTYIPGNINWQTIINDQIDGAALLFKSSENRWSYAKLCEEDIKIIDFKEKQVISPHASTGTYYFKNSATLLDDIKLLIDNNIRENNEFYLSSVYKYMLKQGKNIMPIWADKILCFGTPEDLVASLNEMLLT